ncbi:OFA family MFS transporter [Photobacterium damselae subsp. piscicida]|uniref:hypothetical protein n=1 Tax=Photobacterium damselae TaxID=38293 RepID=UPI0002F1BF57|nr:hypothetical protein [Photobacterium damselae]OLQ82886.1 hypothetical protein BEI67_06780 [Photobacterium damselae subsp. piscicida]TFZ57644.1 hypothetical protein E4T25_11280 [Photobacterium damselae subsp. piscicida]TJZ89541.1 OFA family MFS transporter [Photobacterium damselae subsp. piscicida]BBC42168.1 hypothetical protein PDPE_1-03009 [Photobacterium damselae subsp. piscicida]
MKKFDRAMQILFAGFCINLCMGILYAWSVFKKALVVDLGWSNADASLPYTVAIITFSLSLLVAGVGYGTLRAVFPSIIADFYGLKNYGVLYTAWGVSGFIGPVVAAFAVDTTGTYTLAYAVCSVMIAVVLSFITKKVDAEALEKKLASA